MEQFLSRNRRSKLQTNKLILVALLFWTVLPSFPVLAEDKPADKKKAEQLSKTSEPLSDFEVGRYTRCSSDKDCVIAVNGCCDCANGAKDVAVSKERLEAFKARFDCQKVLCENMDNDLCARGVVSCVKQVCKYFGPEEFKKEENE